MGRILEEVHRIDSHRRNLGLACPWGPQDEGYRAGLLAAAALSKGAVPERGATLYDRWLSRQGASLPPCPCHQCKTVGRVLAEAEASMNQ
jgi:hypothetical protein